jgi:hypothetical protein
MSRSFGKYFFIFFIPGFILALLAVYQSLAQEKSQSINNKYQMPYQPEFQFNAQTSSKSSSYEHPILQLYAEEFGFAAQVGFPDSVLTNSDPYGESISHNNGIFDVTLIDEGDTVRYLLQVSSLPEQPCESNPTRACQPGAAPARGDVAEIQIVLQGGELTPGTYTFGGDRSTAIQAVMIDSRQLYSDPGHGKLGCQLWGAGTLNIHRVVYDANGKLEQLDADLLRVCHQTAPFPATLLEDHPLPSDVENIEQYTYRASWHCRLKVVEVGSR